MKMYKAILSSIALLLSFNASAITVDQAYRSFFDSPVISERHCGQNIHKFMGYLKSNRVSYRQAHVFSVHSDHYDLNHFDARWGSIEKYENGIEYKRSNYNFHVFAVIDGKAYDFSQTGPKAQRLNDYLESVYLPQYRTQNIYFQGRLDRQKVLKQSLKLDVKVYEADEYAKDINVEALYDGQFIEMFTLNNYSPYISPVTIKNPKVDTEDGLLPIIADGKSICQINGYGGSIPYATKFSVTNKIIAAKLSVYYSTSSPLRVDPSSDVRFSYKLQETEGNLPYKQFQYATEVVCTSLATVL